MRAAINSINTKERKFLEEINTLNSIDSLTRGKHFMIGDKIRKMVPVAVDKIKSTKKSEGGYSGDQLTLRLLKNEQFRVGARRLIAKFPKNPKMTPLEKFDWINRQFARLMDTQIAEGEKLPDGWTLYAFTALIMAGATKKSRKEDLGAFCEFITTDWSFKELGPHAIIHAQACGGLEAIEFFSGESISS